MKKTLFKLLTVAIAIATVASCKEPVPEDSITLSSADLISFGYEAASSDIVFTTNADWSAQATSEGDFLSLDKTSGKAGTVTIKLSAKKNEADAIRTGVVNIKAGTALQEISVKQDAVGATSEDVTKTIDFTAQTVTIEMASATDQVILPKESWLKASVSGKVITLEAEANLTGSERSSKFSYTIVKHTVNVTLTQEPESGDLKNPKVSYLGDKAFIYDSENWSYTEFGQYLLSFESEYGIVDLVINENPVGEEAGKAVPTGTFAVDAGGNFADKTFSVTGENCTSFSIAGTEYAVIDGEIEIAQDGNNYTVKASLQDETETVHIYTYSGPLGDIEKDDFGAQVDGAPYYSNYYTYFAGNAYIWSITLFFSAAPEEGSWDISYATFNVVTDAGAAGPEFPTGTFTYAIPENDPEISGNGGLRAIPGTFTFSGNDRPQNSLSVNEGTPTLVISKDSDGKYTFDLTSNIKVSCHAVDEDGYWIYDEDWNPVMIELGTADWNPSFSVEIPACTPGSMAAPDTDKVTFVTGPTMQAAYVGYWYGSYFGEGFNGFAIGWSYVDSNYTVFITLNTDQSYTYEKNFNNRYCSNPIPAGTYTFSNEAVAGNTILPTSRCYIQNSYTGSIYRINGGSITLSDSHVSFDVTGKVSATGAVCSFDGGFDTNCYYIQDYSTRTLPINPVQ